MTAKVMAAGDERGFVTFIEPITQFTGRDFNQEKDIVKVPEWAKAAKRFPALEKFWFK